MAAKPASGVEYFTASRHPNQRRYEALRAYFTEDLTVEQVGARGRLLPVQHGQPAA